MRVSMPEKVVSPAPQVAEIKTPYLMDASGTFLLYDESMVCKIWFIAAKENFIMNIEKRNLKLFNIITVVVLAAILVTTIGGFILQRQTMPSSNNGMGIGRSNNPMMQPESAQTSPTGRLVLSTGIILLLVGFGVLVVMLWVRSNRAHQNPS
jgi:hypothetical protein